MNLTTTLSALTLCALTAHVPAQTDAQLLGLTATSPLLQAQDPTTCAVSACRPGLMPALTNCAGGVAYDTTDRGTWCTDGVSIGKFDTRDLCRAICQPQPVAPLITQRSSATGLAHDHGRSVLYITDDSNGLSIVQTRGGCALRLMSRCSVVVPVGYTLTGVAYDDVRELLFILASQCNQPRPVPGGVLVVTHAADPCQQICSLRLDDCTGQVLDSLRGIAYDACRDELWVTDGITQTAFSIDVANCRSRSLRCCRNPSPNDPYVGLTIEPSTETRVGRPCTNRACPRCAPRLVLGNGDPVLGNLAFALEGEDLPAQSIAAFLINFGPCNAAGPTVAPFCGPILVALSPTILAFSVPTGGTTGCSGAASLTVSIPSAAVGLCDTTLSSQILGICSAPTGAVGTFASDCVSWKITSS